MADRLSLYQRGFSMLEVVISSFVVMVGVAGYVSLQIGLLRSSDSLTLRETAAQLAEAKLLDLRQYQSLNQQASAQSYVIISNDTGGTLAAGELLITVNQAQGRQHRFSRHWQVTNSYFVDTDADSTADSWVDEVTAQALQQTGSWPDRKDVQIQISWQDNQGSAEQLQLSASLIPLSMFALEQGYFIQPDLNQLPAVLLVPSADEQRHVQRSNTIPWQLTDNLPQAQNQFSRRLRQRRILDHTPWQISEQWEFMTLNCRCQLAGNQAARLPAALVYSGDMLQAQPGGWMVKARGVATPGQAPQCLSCCRDHHDSWDSLAAGKSLTYFATTLHRHFDMHAQPATEALYPGDSYDEVCRMLKVGGEDQVFHDWFLAGLRIENMNLPSVNLSPLQAWLTFFSSKQIPLVPETQLLTVGVASDFQIQGVYADWLESASATALQQHLQLDSASWQGLLPVYQVNISHQVNTESLPANALQTDASADTDGNPLLLLQSSSASLSQLVLKQRQGNSGYLGTDEITPAVPQYLSVTIPVEAHP